MLYLTPQSARFATAALTILGQSSTGRQLPASYANFYIANGLVLAPTFNDANDSAALTILAKQFPGREVVGINCTELIWGLGALHCMTQQQPA